MPRFVVLRHEPDAHGGKPLHWDVMFECGSELRTWALSSEPRHQSKIDAEPLANHRLEYLDYEGAISGNRGIVRQWDAGTYELLAQDVDQIRVRVAGRRLQGQVTLERSSSDPQRWIFVLDSSNSTNVR
jgi:hypothetical protein